MIFSKVRFSDNISYGSQGDPDFSTEIVKSRNRYEYRNINWEFVKCKYNIYYAIKIECKYLI